MESSAKSTLIDHSEEEEQLRRHYRQLTDERARRANELARLEQCRGDYDDMSSSLRTLPERVERPILVPHGKMAMFPGKLIHTNEVMVLLGDNYFALRSAHQASEVFGRRSEWVCTQIEAKKEEVDAYDEKMESVRSMVDIHAEQSGTIEIREEYVSEDDDEAMGSNAWRQCSSTDSGALGVPLIQEETGLQRVKGDSGRGKQVSFGQATTAPSQAHTKETDGNAVRQNDVSSTATDAFSSMVIERDTPLVPTEHIEPQEDQRQLAIREPIRGGGGSDPPPAQEASAPPVAVSRFKASRLRGER